MNVFHGEQRRLVRFGIVGLANNLALYLAYLVLLSMTVQPIRAAIFCYCVGVCTSYFLNRTWSFESRDVHSEDLPKFLLAHGVGVCSTIVVLNCLLAWFRPEAAQLINIGITALINYGILMVLGFGGRRAG